jgi:YbbR domain-containing protein
VDPIRPPAGATLLADPDPVTNVRYRAPLDVGVIGPDSFRATVDLSLVDVQPGGQPESVPVAVVALDPRIQVVDFQPREVPISLDPVATRDLPITVTLGTVPEGLNIGPPQTEPSTVTVRGASSRVDAVTAVVARIAIDASALNVDREVALVAVDSNGNQVPNVDVDPERARVRIAVARQLANRTLPLVPATTGQPAVGYRITSVTVEPLVVTVSGEDAIVSQLETAQTEPIDVSGRDSDLEASVRVALPTGVSVAGSDSVRVVISIGQDTGTRTFQVGVKVDGTHFEGATLSIDPPQVNITLGGPISTLSSIDGSQLVATALTAQAAPDGTVPLDFTPPQGTEVIAIIPDRVLVTNVPGGTPVAASPGS